MPILSQCTTPEEADAEFERIDNLPPARRAPSRPWGWTKKDWFSMSRGVRREHYNCCWLPLADFAKEDSDHGKRDGWWLTVDEAARAEKARPSTPE